MSTDRSRRPFRSFEEAAESVLDDPAAGDLAHRLLASLLQSRQRAERAEAEAYTDVLTGVRSRRGWEVGLRAEERRCARYGQPASIVAIDLDGLKAVNDALGHPAGDGLLRAAATALGSAVRDTDTVARVGGDEFAVLAVNADLETARALVERLGAALEAAGIMASLGVAERDPAAGLAAAWEEADRRMYAARRGRERSLTAR